LKDTESPIDLKLSEDLRIRQFPVPLLLKFLNEAQCRMKYFV